MAALRRVQANLKRYRAAVLKAACEGRLVPTEAELAKTENRKFETGEELLARILTERRQNWQGRGNYKKNLPRPKSAKWGEPPGMEWATAKQQNQANKPSVCGGRPPGGKTPYPVPCGVSAFAEIGS